MKRAIFAMLFGVVGFGSGYWFASKQPRNYIHPDLQWQFSEAAARGDMRELERLHARGAQVNATPDSGHVSGFPALVVAAGAGHSEAVRWLIDKGADVNLSPNDTPLECARYRLEETQKTIDILTARGAK